MNFEFPIIYLVFIFIGFLLVYLYDKHAGEFRWHEYFAILVPPIIGVVLLTKFLGPMPIYIFLGSTVVGPALEWSIGFVYYKVFGSHLWLYERYPLPGKYTSYLAAPLWGMGLTFFWLIFRNL